MKVNIVAYVSLLLVNFEMLSLNTAKIVYLLLVLVLDWDYLCHIMKDNLKYMLLFFSSCFERYDLTLSLELNVYYQYTAY